MVGICVSLHGWYLCVSLQFLGLFNTFPAMVGFCVAFGCLSGVFFTMTHAIVIEFVGMEGYRVTIGCVLLFNGFSTAVGYPTVGR